MTGHIEYFRRLTSKVFYILSLTPLLVLFFSVKAEAYIDPSSGSYFFQILLAGILGVVFAIKLFWRRILGIFKSSKDKNNNQNA